MRDAIVGLLAVYQQWEAVQCVFDQVGEAQCSVMSESPSNVAALMVGGDGTEMRFEPSCNHRREYLVVCAEESDRPVRRGKEGILSRLED